VLEEKAMNVGEGFYTEPFMLGKAEQLFCNCLHAHKSMSTQKVTDVSLQKRMPELLLGNLNLYENLRTKAGKAR
jgi:hypothetical protein